MAKNLKLNIKNTQLAKAAGLDKLKAKLSGKETEKAKEEKEPKTTKQPPAEAVVEEQKPPRVRAKTRSAFAKEEKPETSAEEPLAPTQEAALEPEVAIEPALQEPVEEEAPPVVAEPVAPLAPSEKEAPVQPIAKEPVPFKEPHTKLGPTGRHINDLLPRKKEPPKKEAAPAPAPSRTQETKTPSASAAAEEDLKKKDLHKGKKVKEFKDLKPLKRDRDKGFDGRARQGLSEGDEERWRKRRPSKGSAAAEWEEPVVRPTKLKIRLPIVLKDLAVEMKLKASELIQKLFLHGLIYTLNDVLDDETVVQYIGSEFGCEIKIDTSEQERIQITARSIREEITSSNHDDLIARPPVVAFMGHVDHGKTSLIDAIRKTNVAGGEAGAITQHIGAFRCKTAVGDLTILDTPGHEAFSAMRARGAEVTDIVVLVVAGDEGLREQTFEAIEHAKSAKVTIVVAINKCDKPNFNVENVYRELSERELLPEAWGGQTITINTSAVTGEGIQQLLEMLALQSEVMELRANPKMRARGTVIESELHKGLGSVARVLVQNGTLRVGDAVVFERHWGKVKTMHDEHGKLLQTAGPSTPVEITGLSGIPKAGDPFIVVASEKEARDIIETREVGRERTALQQKKAPAIDSLLQKGAIEKKVLKLLLRADVQGSVEALKTSILKIKSDKASVDIIAMGIGEVSESDIELAAASNAVIIGFHTAIESHAEPLIKELGVKVRQFDIIYHAVDEVKKLMLALLDKLEEEKDTGVAEVKATFKASQLGVIAGCQVIEGTISRNNRLRLVRDGQVVWKGHMGSLKRVKEDVKEVKKGFECGILLEGNNDVRAGDLIQAYEIIYITQEL
ncbi:translation initiation factor IF-2 [Chlamydiota bacterium]